MDLSEPEAHCMIKHLSAIVPIGEAIQKLNRRFLSTLSEEELEGKEIALDEERRRYLEILKKLSDTYTWLRKVMFRLDEISYARLQDALRTHRSRIQGIVEDNYGFLRDLSRGSLANLLDAFFNLQKADDPHTLSKCAETFKEDEAYPDLNIRG